MLIKKKSNYNVKLLFRSNLCLIVLIAILILYYYATPYLYLLREDNDGENIIIVNNHHSLAQQHNQTRHEQIENYKQNKSILLNVHITHHAGTTTCHLFQKYGPAPLPACLHDKRWPSTRVPVNKAWTYEETSRFIPLVRKVYHMISWEFTAYYKSPNPPLAVTHWEHPHLVSIIIMRHPIDRLLALDQMVDRDHGPVDRRSVEQWWEFANSRSTNNFALTILASDGKCCRGKYTSDVHLEQAKQLLSRFTFVLDQECLTEGLEELVTQLGLSATIVRKELQRSNQRYRNRHKETLKEKINNATLYDYLVERNRVDIALYEWSKTISLVNCSALL